MRSLSDHVFRTPLVERSLSLRQTCRQMGQSTFRVLVDATNSLFQGSQPDLSWLD